MKDINNNQTRRRFIKYTVGAVAGSSLMSGPIGVLNTFAKPVVKPKGATTNFRIGSVAYSYQYSIGLFQYKTRGGEKFDTIDFLRANHKAGGNVAQIYSPMLSGLDDVELQKIRDFAESTDTTLEVVAGNGLGKDFKSKMRVAATLGAKIVGCNFGFLMRPEKISTLREWNTHMEKCTNRLKELASIAKSMGLKIAVENHFDFTAKEMRRMIETVDSPNVGILFDIGNVVGTLDDPIIAADILGPLTVATHYKDFAIEETEKGFRFCMVPLGYGSLRLREITEKLLTHIDSNVCLTIEMLNGQNFEVDWLKKGFWEPFDEKPVHEVTATLRHIRSKKINYEEYILLDEVNRMAHDELVKYEQKRQKMCNDYLKKLIRELV